MGKKGKESKEIEKIDLQIQLRSVPDGGWGWLVCLAGFIAQFIILGIQNNTGILYKALLDEFKQSKGDTAWVLSIGLGMMFLFAPVTSALCERVGCRVVALVGGLIGIVGFVSSSFVKDVHILYATFGMLWGIGSSMCYLPTLRSLPYWFSRRIGLANGIVTAGSGVGTIAMGPVMQLLIDHLGWANSARALAGILAFCTLGSLLYKMPKQAQVAEKQTEGRPRAPIFDFSVFKNRAFLVWCVGLSAFIMGYFIPFVHLPAYAVESGIPNSQASTLIGMMSVGSTFGRLFFGRLCDHPKVNRLYVFQMAFLIIGIADTLSTLTRSYAGLVVYMVVFGVFDGCYVVLLAVICADIVGVDKVSSGIGVQFFFMSITAIAGPPLAGVIYDVSKSYQIAFYAAGASAALATCILFLVPVLMPVETCQDGRASAEYERRGEKTPLDGIRSPDSSNPTGSTKTSLGSCQKLNSEGSLLTRGQSYIDRYWHMPKQASMASLLSLKFIPVTPADEILVVVDRVSQV